MAGAAELAADDGPPGGANADGALEVLAGAGGVAELGGRGGERGIELLDEVCGAGGGGGGEGGGGRTALVGAGATGVTVGAGAMVVYGLGVAVVAAGA